MIINYKGREGSRKEEGWMEGRKVGEVIGEEILFRVKSVFLRIGYDSESLGVRIFFFLNVDFCEC